MEIRDAFVVLSLILVCASAHVGANAQSTSALPADIDPESLSRLRALAREDLDADGQAAYDLVVGDGPRPVTGPRAMSLYSPKVAEAFHILNEYLRRDGVLESRHVEVAILVAAWEIEQQYEWTAHEPAALRYGAPQAVVDTIKFDREPHGLSRAETLIINFGRQLLREHRVSPEVFAEAVDIFGEQGVVELTVLMGDYVMAGMLLTAVDQHQPADRPPLLPER